MSNNSYITADGLEIGRAQGVQAEAAGIAATADMNPVLLKPSSETESQVVIHGRPHSNMHFRAYRQEGYAVAAAAIQASLQRLRAEFDVVVIEGAGSPAEVNLRERELANMRIAEWAEAPVLLVADIDRGGALAALVGTLALLEPNEQERIAGLIINKFRGDKGLLQPAVEFLEHRTGKPVVGVLPYLDTDLEAEDSQSLTETVTVRSESEGLRVCAIRLPRISNFTDLDPLRQAPGVEVEWVQEPRQLHGADAVVIPGSKNTAEDLRWLWQTGLAAQIQRLAARGVPVVGICGGYQMLGNRVLDPDGYESAHPETPGLELMDSETAFGPSAAKVTEQTRAVLQNGVGPFMGRSGMQVSGYEIHMGVTDLGPTAAPLLRSQAGTVLGGVTQGGQVWGGYLHDIFHNDGLREAWLVWLWRRKGLTPPPSNGPTSATRREATLDRLAAAVRTELDMQRLYTIVGLTMP